MPWWLPFVFNHFCLVILYFLLNEKSRSYFAFFRSFPEASSITSRHLIIDGCIDHMNNIKVRKILHNPNTLYIVMIRDYADMIWSAYNYWCKRGFDSHGSFSLTNSINKVLICNLFYVCFYEGCKVGMLSEKDVQIRSPEQFHYLIESDIKGVKGIKQPYFMTLTRPCQHANQFFTS